MTLRTGILSHVTAMIIIISERATDCVVTKSPPFPGSPRYIESRATQIPRRVYHRPRAYACPRFALLAHRCQVPLRIGSIVARLRWKRRRFVQKLRSA